MWKAALRRLALLVVGVSGATCVLSLLLGLALGASALRSISVGFYAMGAFLLVAGFFLGNRGPVRARADAEEAVPITGIFRRRLRFVTAEEHTEALALSAVTVTLGLLLIVLGAVADPMHKLY